MSSLNEEQDSGPPLPDLSGGQMISLGTVAPSYGITSPRRGQADYLQYEAKRSFGTILFSNTGGSYLLGGSFGVPFGFIQGLQKSPNTRWKVRRNAILNECGRHGARISNVAGSVAVLYSFYEYFADALDVDKALPADVNFSLSPLIAGFCTGATYKATAGPRVAALAGTIGLGCVGTTNAIYLAIGLPQGAKGFLFF